MLINRTNDLFGLTPLSDKSPGIASAFPRVREAPEVDIALFGASGWLWNLCSSLYLELGLLP